MDIFPTLGSGSLSVTAMLDFSGKANTSIHGLEEVDTAAADPSFSLNQHRFNVSCLVSISRVVSRYREPQLQVGENLPCLFDLRPDICKS